MQVRAKLGYYRPLRPKKYAATTSSPALLQAAHVGHVGTVRLLLDALADTECRARDETRDTPLLRAARLGLAGTVRCLADEGADTEAKGEST